ncbi:hypothetical protein [Persicitalea jodogahamensis]|uniref:Uncharacterized protein n=1 Tax=Persicitalea jodogahamensis TaxID=402147 RepID=A0A8J3GBL4_9BACT|nr:hypothetical protein [Persicitalea jodogahamensis]GHB87676.1 hypothetical protein GCM10007390_49630 [Persicitalea jodogahamensis]
MEQIILGGIVLSFIHAVIPSHWLPFVTIGNARGWDRATLLRTTFLAGTAHTLSTTIFGLLVSYAGFQLSDSQQLIAGRIVPLLLLILGLWFVMQHYLGHSHTHLEAGNARGRSHRRLLLSLVVVMFFSPCFEISAYFLSAGTMGWRAVAVLAALYNVLTLAGMLAMVGLGQRGLEKLDIGWLRHNEQLITGMTLCGLAAFNFFTEF